MCQFENPLYVAVPFITGRNVPSRETIVKVLYADDIKKEWTEVNTKDTSFDKIKVITINLDYYTINLVNYTVSYLT